MLLALAADTDEQRAALSALVDLRSASKALSTWAENLDILGDGRVHATWKMHTVTGRFASSPNMQNHGPQIQKLFRAAAPGWGVGHPAMTEWVLVGVDLSQAELRYIAYTANDPVLLRMYDEGIDVHTVNVALFFQMRCPPEAAANTNAQTEKFLVEQVPLLLGPTYDYAKFPVCPKAKWKPIRTLAKNAEFGSNYMAMPETIFDVLRAKRDVDTGKLLFPDLDLALVEALLAIKLRARPALPKWWSEVIRETQKRGYHQCPVSGRIRFFRDGFKKNDVVNSPIQMGVASVMNKRLLKLQSIFDYETGGACQVVLQVHDALTFECPKSYAPRCQEVIYAVMHETFALPNHPVARLPCDMPKIGEYVDQV